MLSRDDSRCTKRESDDGDQLQRGPFSPRHHSHGRALVCSLPFELSACRRADGGAWGPDRPRDDPALGREIQSPVRRGVSSPETPGEGGLEDGRDLYQRQRSYLYRAVDKTGQTIDFLLTEQRDEEAALRFLKKAIRRHGVPEKITIDGSAANEAAIKRYNAEHGTTIAIRKIKYLNNIVE